MSTIRIRSTSVGSCQVTHDESGATIHTDMPTEYGGAGGSFSATDLLAASLGVCIATNVDSVAVRHGIPLGALEIQVQKTLSQEPKGIASIIVTINISMSTSGDVRLRLERAAQQCLVHKSLHPDLKVVVEMGSRPVNENANQK